MRAEKTIGIAAFRAECSALIDAVERGRIRRLILTRHHRPIAAIVPVEHDVPELWGAMRGSVKVAPGTDLTAPTIERWTALD